MKKNFTWLILFFLVFSCANDDWKDELSAIKSDLADQQKLINTLNQGVKITSVVPNGDGYTIAFSDGTSVSVSDGHSPLISIGDDGNWYIDDKNTNVKAAGTNGESPTVAIGNNGNWIIDGTDTGIKAAGVDGQNGENAPKIISIVQNSESFIFYFDDGTSISVPNNKKRIICWGDSHTANPNGWVKTLQEHLGNDYIIINCGVGGETASTILARQGGVPMYIPNEFVLPADGSEVEIANGAGGIYLRSSYDNNRCSPLIQGGESIVNPIFINGNECTLTKYTIDSNVSSYLETNTRWTIKRNTATSRDVKIPAGTLVYTRAAKEYRNADIVIFFAVGTNGGWSTPEDLANKLDLAIDFDESPNYVIFAMAGGNASSMASLESHFSSHFGLRYFNLRQYLSTEALYEAGIVPTAEDLERMAVGSVPTSILISDKIHFNDAGHKIIGNLVYQRMTLLGLFQ